MARCLIIGCGCRGRSLARELIERGHAVRGTTRDASRREVIEAVGAEAVIADPDRIGTLTEAFDHVSIVCLLLGSAKGSAESLAALHGPRLAALLRRMLDTTVRGIVYEASGPACPGLLDAGAEEVRLVCEDSQIPYQLLRAEPGDHEEWLRATLAAVECLLRAAIDSRNN